MKNIITKDSFDNFVNTSKPEEINGALYDVTAINHCLDKGFNTGYIKGAKNSMIMCCIMVVSASIPVIMVEIARHKMNKKYLKEHNLQ